MRGYAGCDASGLPYFYQCSDTGCNNCVRQNLQKSGVCGSSFVSGFGSMKGTCSATGIPARGRSSDLLIIEVFLRSECRTGTGSNDPYLVLAVPSRVSSYKRCTSLTLSGVTVHGYAGCDASGLPYFYQCSDTGCNNCVRQNLQKSGVCGSSFVSGFGSMSAYCPAAVSKAPGTAFAADSLVFEVYRSESCLGDADAKYTLTGECTSLTILGVAMTGYAGCDVDGLPYFYQCGGNRCIDCIRQRLDYETMGSLWEASATCTSLKGVSIFFDSNFHSPSGSVKATCKSSWDANNARLSASLSPVRSAASSDFFSIPAYAVGIVVLCFYLLV